MKGTSRSLLLGGILFSAIGFTACSDDTEDEVIGASGGALTNGGSSSGGKSAGGAAQGGKPSGGASAQGGGAQGGGAQGGATAQGGGAQGGATAQGGGAQGGATAQGGGAQGGGAGAPQGGATTAGAGGATTAGAGGLITAGAGGATTAGAGGATTAGAGGTAGTAGDSGTAGTAGSTAASFVMNYDFEADAEGWDAAAGTTIASSADRAITGTHSLKVTVPALPENTDKTVSIGANTVTALLYPGSVITFNVWSPAGSGDGLYLQSFCQYNTYSVWSTQQPTTFNRGGWSTWTYTVPDITPGGLLKFGVQFGVSAGGSFAGGDFYVDAITSTGAPATCADPSAATSATRFDFETATADWSVDQSPTDTVLSVSADRASNNSQSLKVAMTNVGASGATTSVERNLFGNLVAHCGKTMTASVWIPTAAASALTVKGFSQHSGWQWSGGSVATVTADSWSPLTYTLPTAVDARGVQRVGIQISIPAAAQPFTGDIYIDNVQW